MNSHVLAGNAYDELDIDASHSTGAMWLFIGTEAFLFVVLFFTYFYLRHHNIAEWPPGEPPKILLASIMLGVLLGSSVVLHLGEKALKQGREALARVLVAGTLLLGAVFMVLQVLEYRNHLKTHKPTTDAYGSIFYTITTIHALHLLLGMTMLLYVLILPQLRAKKSPYRPLHNAGLYWHFVDTVWVLIVMVLYWGPRFGSN